jgi:chromosomal replication initiator protein
VSDDLAHTWARICGVLREQVADYSFEIWLAPLEPAGLDGPTLYVRAPDHIRSWVQERYAGLLRDAALQVAGRPLAVEVVDRAWTAPTGVEAAGQAPPAEPAGDRLNPKYSFEQFVIGPSNRFAHAAALAVAEQPAQAYNPLFLHGPPGLGKTHLLHAIGNYVRRFERGLRVRYATIEAFTSEFVATLRRQGDIAAFKQRFRELDVLLVDDVQFIADKERTKEEFFHTFNALYESGSQLVIASDRPPDDLRDLESRLRERFECGLVAELEPPGPDVRKAILRQRASHDGMPELPDETLEEIAHHVTASVRVLEGALVRIVAYASLRGVPVGAISPDLARDVLRRLYPARRPCSLTDIQAATARSFDLTPEELLARDRRPRVALARQIAMYLARELTDATLPAIGAGFGGRNHTTILHAHRRITSEIARDPATSDAVATLRAALAAPAPDRPC